MRFRRLLMVVLLSGAALTAVGQRSTAPGAVGGTGGEWLGVPYPNPAVDRVRVPLRLAAPGDVSVQVHDLTGRRVLAARQFLPAGGYEIQVDLGSLAAGLYVVRVTAGDRRSAAVSFVRAARGGGTAGVSFHGGASAPSDFDPVHESAITAADAAIGPPCPDDSCASGGIVQPPDSLVNSLGMVFTRIPAARFTMGSDHGPGDERPAHAVRLTRDVWVARTEVSRADFARMVPERSTGPAWASDRRPVTDVTWFEAAGFANALSRAEGYAECYGPGGVVLSGKITDCPGYRLLTEAEWEFMARAGTATAWSFGDDVSRIGDFAWYADNSSYGTRGTRAVGVKAPNRWGIHDVHGNAWEWVHDGYGTYADETATDPDGAGDGATRVIRGGSYWSDPPSIRSRVRGFMDPAGRNPGVGFRIARTADGPALPGGPPAEPSDPDPPDGRRGVAQNGSLSWIAADRDGDELTFDVYFGTREPLPLAATGLTEPRMPMPPVGERTTYRWRVEASDGRWAMQGPLWTFTTGPEPGVQVLPTARNSIGMEFVRVRPGRVRTWDHDRSFEVTLTRPYWIGIYETTGYEFDKVMKESAPERVDGLPAGGVTWFEAVEFANALSRLEGVEECYRPDRDPFDGSIYGCAGYRLPTYVEWVYAARGGTTASWSFGDDESRLADHAWYYVNSGQRAHPVGTLLPNPWGLYDVHGNLEEWVHDSPVGSQDMTDRVDLVLRGYVEERGVLGGSFWSNSRGVQSGALRSLPRNSRNERVGFRLARGSAPGGRPPEEPRQPSPVSGSVLGHPDTVTLSWSGADPDGDILAWEVHFGTTYPPPPLDRLVTRPEITVGPLEGEGPWYWQVFARDGQDRTAGPEWVFLARGEGPAALDSTTNAWGSSFLRVPAGSFGMGTAEGQSVAGPPHEVRLGSDFWMQRLETTQAEFERVTGTNPSRVKAPDLPVDQVTWFEATRYANAVSRSQGYEACYAADGSYKPGAIYACEGYRLPTEAEFEAAARAGTRTVDWFGDAQPLTGQFAWTPDNSWRRSRPGGGKPPNPWGFRDLLGNVGEMAHDAFDGSRYAEGLQLDPVLQSDDPRRVERGGSIVDRDANALTAKRLDFSADQGAEWRGFRLVRTAREPAGSPLPPNAAILPGPPDRSIVEPGAISLSWSPGFDAGDPVTYDLYFGTVEPPPLVAQGLAAPSFDPGPLQPRTVYHWRVVSVGPTGRSRGVAWKFLTDDAPVALPLDQISTATGVELVRIRRGHFEMGSSGLREGPVRRVVLAQDVLLGRFEVTQEQYAAIVGSNPSLYAGSARLPVERVTWMDAIRFVNALSAAEGLPRCYDDALEPIGDVYRCEGYRLPSEAEWEYAARAGTTADRFFEGTGADLGEYAWYSANSSGSGPREVGIKQPNPWGLFDLYGNVAEWVADPYGAYDPADTWNPMPERAGDLRVIRGGSWAQGAEWARSAGRATLNAGVAMATVGFRVARTAR